MKITTVKSAGKPTIKEIKINEATVQHIIDASRIAGVSEGAAFIAALISQICEFDGKRLTYEDVSALPIIVFLELSAALVTSGVLPSEEALSTLSVREDSATKA